MVIISGSSNPSLCKRIAKKGKLVQVPVEITKFPNGEKRIYINKPLWNKDVIIVQSLSFPTDENIIELLLLIDAAKRVGAKTVTLFIPWFSYALQDRSYRFGEPISAKVVANLLSNSGCDRIFLMDVHNENILGFFSLPTYHLTANDLFSRYIKKFLLRKNTVLVCPDISAVRRVQLLSENLKLPLIFVDKRRDRRTGRVYAASVQGKVEGQAAILYDDGVITGSTLIEAGRLLKKNGATSVNAIVTHMILPQIPNTSTLFKLVDKLITTNSISHQISSPKIIELHISSIFIQALKYL